LPLGDASIRLALVPDGIKLLRFVFLWGAVVLFLGLWVWFFVDIWTKDDEPVDLDQKALYLAAGLGGILGTFFGVSMGVERKDPDKDARKVAPGSTLLGTSTPAEKGVTDSLATFAVWVYALVGLGAIVTVFVHSPRAPGAVETLATTFGGFLLAIVTAAFAPGQEPPNPPPNPPPPNPAP
jgi:hypothetical protein